MEWWILDSNMLLLIMVPYIKTGRAQIHKLVIYALKVVYKNAK